MDSVSLENLVEATFQAYKAADFESAVRFGDEAAKLARGMGDYAALAVSQWWRGDALVQKGKLRESLPHLLEVVKLTDPAVDPSFQQIAAAQIIQVAIHIYPLSLVYRLLDEAENRFGGLSGLGLRQTTMYARASLELLRGNFKDALGCASEALRLKQQSSSGLGVTFTYLSHILQVARCYFRLRDSDGVAEMASVADEVPVEIEYDRFFRIGVHLLLERLRHPHARLGTRAINDSREILRFTNPSQGIEVLDLFMEGIRALIRAHMWDEVGNFLQMLPEELPSDALKFGAILLRGDALVAEARSVLKMPDFDDDLAGPDAHLGRLTRSGAVLEMLKRATGCYCSICEMANSEDDRLGTRHFSTTIQQRINYFTPAAHVNT